MIQEWMFFPRPLIPVKLLQRYKRFLADVELTTGEVITVHCPNSGSMKGCSDPGSLAYISRSDNAGRKHAHTLELVQSNGHWAGVNTMLPNPLVREAIENGTIVELAGYDHIRGEVKISANSRIDFVLEGKKGTAVVEVKNVTLVGAENIALFPDAVTERGRKHLFELMEVVRQGHRGVILFTVQREDAVSVSPADSIDPEYGQTLRDALAAGVEALAYQAYVSPAEIRLVRPLPVIV